MSKDLTTISSLPLALTAPEEEINELQEAIAMNAGHGGISEFDLQRIKIGPGAFKVQVANGTTLVDRLTGVVVYIRDIRAYYKLKDQGSRPPDCSSADCITGRGDPGGDCKTCPLSQFESATGPDGKQGKGQACKQVKQLFMLRGDSLLPEVVAIPPTSLVRARSFFTWLIGQRTPYAKALISISVQNAKNGNQEYGTAVFELIRKLTPEEASRTMKFNQMMDAFLHTRDISGTDAATE